LSFYEIDRFIIYNNIQPNVNVVCLIFGQCSMFSLATILIQIKMGIGNIGN